MSILNDIGVGLLGFTNAYNSGQDRLLRERMLQLQAHGLDRQDALARSQIELEQQKIKQQKREYDMQEQFYTNMPGVGQGGQGQPAAPSAPSSSGGVTPANGPVADMAAYWGRYYGLSPEQQAVLPRIITAESGGNQWAHRREANGSDSFGPMQINSVNLGMLGPGENIFDPSVNTRIGTEIFKRNLDQFGGDTTKALWGYNAGPERVKQGVMPDSTRAYIGKITGSPTSPTPPGTNYAAAPTNTVSDAGGTPPQAPPQQGGNVDPGMVSYMLKGALSPSKQVREASTAWLSNNKAALDIQYARSPEYQSRLKTQEAIATAKGTMPVDLEKDRLKREGEARSPKMSDNLNFINNLAPLIADGTATEEQQRQYALAFNAEFGKVQELPDGSRVRLAPPPGNIPAPAGWVAELPGQKPLGPTDAGKQASFVQAEKIVADVEAKMFPGGKFDRQTILAMQFPTSDSAAIKDDIRNAVDNIIKARTGAAAPDPEMNRYLDMFVPGPFDSETRARNKIARLKEFFRTALDVTNNRGVNAGGAPVGGNNDPLGVR